MKNPFKRSADPPETRDLGTISISDPAIALFGAAPSLTGVNVTEHSTLGLAAVHRCVEIIAGGIASLPLRAVQEQGGITEVVPSWLDNPAGPYTKHELIETTLLHLLLHGNAYWAVLPGGAGQVLGVQPIHPMLVCVELDPSGAKTYKVTLGNGKTQTFDDSNLTHIKGMAPDYVRGYSPLELARNGAFGVALAADRSAASLFGNGALMSAIVTSESIKTSEEAEEIKQKLTLRAAGVPNAGNIAVFNRDLNITPWSLSNEDAQWLQSREFQKSEIATWFGVPDTLVGLSEKQSSWGTGIAEMHRAMASWTFKLWTSRIEDRLSRLLPMGTIAQFDYKGLLAPAPEKEIALLIAQVQGGLLTQNEARKRQNLPPIEGGDVLLTPQPQPEAAA